MNFSIKRILFCMCLLTTCCLRAGEQPLSEQECLDFAKKIEAGIAQGNAKVFDEALDLKGLLQRAVEGTEVKGSFRQTFTDDAGRTFTMGAQIIRALADGGSYKFMRMRQEDGKPRLLFRMISTQGVNYHDCILVRNAQGNVQIHDIFVFLSGELLSQTLRRVYLQIGASKDSLVGDLQGWEGDFVKNAEKIRRMILANMEGRASEARTLYFELPESIQTERSMLILRTQWASRLNEAEYSAALAAIEKSYPNDPSMQFIGIDGFFLNKKYDEGLNLLDKLIQNQGPDAYLYMLKGNFYMAKGDLPMAVTWHRKGIELEPDMLELYYALLMALQQQQDFAAIREALLVIERRALAIMDGVAKAAEFAEFVKSPEYERWLKERPKQAIPEEKPAGK